MKKKTGRKSEREFTLRQIRNISVSFGKKGPNPWKTSPLGQHGFDPPALAALLVWMIGERYTYRKASDVLSASPDILRMLGLEKAPSKSALHAAFLRPGPEYLRKMIAALGRPGARGNISAGSTGFATLLYEAWISAKYGDGSRVAFDKLHIACADNGIIAAYVATPGHAGDSPALPLLCAQLPRGSGDLRADAAYPSYLNCEAAEEIGRRPVIMIRSNSRPNGYGARGRMIRWARESPDELGAAYHKRSIAESVFSSMKRRIGSVLRSRAFAAQSIELALFVACHNIHVLANL